MPEAEQKEIFARNLNECLSITQKTQKEVADAIGVSPQTFNTWCKGVALPRMGKIQKLAEYFHVSKTDLIDDKAQHNISEQDDRAQDLFKRLDSADKGRVIERMETMLEADKYQEKEGSLAG